MLCSELAVLEQERASLLAQPYSEEQSGKLDALTVAMNDHKMCHHSGLTTPKCGPYNL